MQLLSILRSLLFSERSITESFLNKYSGLLYGIIIRIVKDQQSAEEVLQRVLAQMTVELKQPHSPHLKLITRMTQLARTLSKDRIKEQPVPVPLPQADNDVIQYGCPSGSELVEGVILNGRSQQEVAQSLGIPLSVVRSKMRIALQALEEVSYTSEVWETSSPSGSKTGTLRPLLKKMECLE